MEVAQRFQHIYTIAKNKVEGLFALIDEIAARGEKVIIYIKYLDEIRFSRSAESSKEASMSCFRAAATSGRR